MKKVIENNKKLSLEKFRIAELKNPRMIIGGGDDTKGTKTPPVATISAGTKEENHLSILTK